MSRNSQNSKENALKLELAKKELKKIQSDRDNAMIELEKTKTDDRLKTSAKADEIITSYVSAMEELEKLRQEFEKAASEADGNKQNYDKAKEELEKIRQEKERTATEVDKTRQQYERAMEELNKIRKAQEKAEESKKIKLKSIEDTSKVPEKKRLLFSDPVTS